MLTEEGGPGPRNWLFTHIFFQDSLTRKLQDGKMAGFGPEGAADGLGRGPLCLSYPNTPVCLDSDSIRAAVPGQRWTGHSHC